MSLSEPQACTTTASKAGSDTRRTYRKDPPLAEYNRRTVARCPECPDRSFFRTAEIAQPLVSRAGRLRYRGAQTVVRLPHLTVQCKRVDASLGQNTANFR